MSDTEHPFAQYIRILGKGKTGTRSLDDREAREAFTMILRGECDPMQVGAFLMLLRVKEETGDELAGFVRACRDVMEPPPPNLHVDLDWSSYAGKKHQHPWYLLSILLLAQAGYRILIHGTEGHTPGRLYTEQAMRELGMPVAGNWRQVEEQLDERGITYLSLRSLCPPLHDLMQLRPLLGLRSPVNTLARMLNPLGAEYSLQSIFHPAYARLHQDADDHLGQPAAMVFKGDSGEVEIKPQADTRLQILRSSQREELVIPRRIQTRVEPVDAPSTEPLRVLWRGNQTDAFGLEAVLGTTTAALILLNDKLEFTSAREQAETLWHSRNKGHL